MTVFMSQVNTEVNVTYPDSYTLENVNFRHYIVPSSTNTTVVQSTDPMLMTSYDEYPFPDEPFPTYWTVVPGVNQYLPMYKIVVPSGWDNNYIALMIRKSAVDGLRVNGQSTDNITVVHSEYVPLGDVEYSVITAKVTEGELIAESIDDTPFGLMVYGHRGDAGYGFAGNVVLR
jgi:hypothetical protein